MNWKTLASGLLLIGSFGTASPAFCQSSPPTSEKAKQVEVLVNRAAALIDSKGKVAFADFRVKGSEWFHDDTYLFVYDLKSNVLLNPAFPAREGTKVTGQKDSTASYFTMPLFRQLKARDRDGSTTCSRNPDGPNRRRSGPS